MAKNTMGKMRKVNNPYEVWKSGDWECQGTIYVYVSGGCVQEVTHSDTFGASISVEIIDYDNTSAVIGDPCDCDGNEHSHEVYEFGVEAPV